MLTSDLQHVGRLLGRKGRRWAGLQIALSMLVVGADYLIAVVLVVFLSHCGILPDGRLPAWLDPRIGSIGGFWFLVVFVAAGLVRGLLVLASAQLGRASLELVRLRLTLAHGYEMLVSEKQRAIPLSEINLRMSEYIAKAPDFVFNACEAVSYAVRAVGLGALLLFVAWRETAVGVLAFSVVAVVTVRLSRRLSRLSREIPAKRSVLEKLMVRVSRNWVFVRASNLCRREHAAFTEGALGYFGSGVRLLFHLNVFSVLPPFLGTLGVLLTVYAGIAVFHTPPLVLAGFFYLFLRFAQTASRAVDRIGVASHLRAQFEGALGILADLPQDDLLEALRPDVRAGLVSVSGPMTADDGPETADGRAAGPEQSDGPVEVELRNVTFGWSGTPRPVLERFSLHIPSGSLFGVSGPNGCGKSTLLALMVGVLRPDGGQALIDGDDAHAFSLRTNRISYVATDPFLTQGSVRHNLTYGIPGDATDRELWPVLEAVGLDAAVRSLPGGLDYTIDEDQTGLSSGQNQKLSLARALLRRPRLLVLDEATTNIDAASEPGVVALLAGMRGRCTVVITSHNEAMLAGVDARLDMPGDA